MPLDAKTQAGIVAGVVVAVATGITLLSPSEHPARLDGSACVMPDCRELPPSKEVDCRFGGALGLPDGGPRWRGCNVGPAQYAVGADCVPVPCEVIAGETLEDAAKRLRK